MALADIGRKALGIVMGIFVLPAAVLAKLSKMLFEIEVTGARARGASWLQILIFAPINAAGILFIVAFFAVAVSAFSVLLGLGHGYYWFAKGMRERNYDLFNTAIATLTLGTLVAVGFLLFSAISLFVVTPLFFLPFHCMKVAEREGGKAALMLPFTLWDRLHFGRSGPLLIPTFIPLIPERPRLPVPRAQRNPVDVILERAALSESREATLEQREAAQRFLLNILTNHLQDPIVASFMLGLISRIRDPDTGEVPQVIADWLQGLAVPDATAENARCETEKALWKQESKAFNAVIDTAEASRVPQLPPLTEGELNHFEATELSPEMKSQCEAYREQMTCPITGLVAEYPVTVFLLQGKNNESKEEAPSNKEKKESKEEIPYKVYERAALKKWIEQYIETQIKAYSPVPARDIPEPTARADLNTLDILLSYPQSFESFVGSVRNALAPPVEKTEQPLQSATSLVQVSVIPNSMFSKSRANPSPTALSAKTPSHESPALR